MKSITIGEGLHRSNSLFPKEGFGLSIFPIRVFYLALLWVFGTYCYSQPDPKLDLQKKVENLESKDRFPYLELKKVYKMQNDVDSLLSEGKQIGAEKLRKAADKIVQDVFKANTKFTINILKTEDLFEAQYNYGDYYIEYSGLIKKKIEFITKGSMSLLEKLENIERGKCVELVFQTTTLSRVEYNIVQEVTNYRKWEKEEIKLSNCKLLSIKQLD